jgi:hypothetical protein
MIFGSDPVSGLPPWCGPHGPERSAVSASGRNNRTGLGLEAIGDTGDNHPSANRQGAGKLGSWIERPSVQRDVLQSILQPVRQATIDRQRRWLREQSCPKHVQLFIKGE